MATLETFFLIFLSIQVVHSIEEVITGFHKKFPLFKMPLWVFVAFEFVFQGSFWIIFLNNSFEGRETLVHIFALLMFANGLWHVVWWGIAKKYVSGLITAPLHLVTFLVFYFTVLV